MPVRPSTSRVRYAQYKRDLAAKQTEGTRPRTALPGKPEQRRRHRTFLMLLAEFLRLLTGHRLTLAVTLGMLTLATLLKLIPPYATKLVFDNVLGEEAIAGPLSRWIPETVGRRELLAGIAVAIIGIALVALVIGMWSRWLATRMTKRVQASVRKVVFEHAVRLPLHRIHQLKSGGVASILREDAGGIAELIFGMLYNPWRAIITLLGCLIVLAVVDWRLLLGSLILIPVVFVTHRTWIARIRPLYRDIRATRQDVDSHATESFAGMRVVRSFSRQHTETNRFARNTHLMIRQEILAWWWSRGVDIAWSILTPLASAALLWYGGLRVLDGAMTRGDLVMFVFYLGLLLEPLATLAASATQFQNSLSALDRVLDLLEEPRELPSRDSAQSLVPTQVRGRITLRDITFSYPGTEHPVLIDINLDVEPGEMVALIGPSGAGKTTLCNLVARFYDPDSGTIQLDGTDLRDLDLDGYRRLLGIVDQDIFLFDGTIRENIAYGRRGARDEEIIRAAELANAHTFISELGHGYETLIGERGVKLSGGQRQRLAIARAILADPRILILDEATSNLDTESERLIQRSLQTLMAGRTSFVIAHRLSTIRHADRIVVIENGRVIEVGSHNELMSRSGRYREMVRLQTTPPAPITASNGESPPETGGAAVSASSEAMD